MIIILLILFLLMKKNYCKPCLKRPIKNRQTKVSSWQMVVFVCNVALRPKNSYDHGGAVNGSLMISKILQNVSLGAFCNTFGLH